MIWLRLEIIIFFQRLYFFVNRIESRKYTLFLKIGRGFDIDL